MNLYFLLEGERTEKRIYRAWLSHAFPELRFVDVPEAMNENCVLMISGRGYPQYLQRLDQVLDDIDRIVKNRVDHLFICVDAEETSFEAKLAEVEEHVKQAAPVVRTSVIVQMCCIETWLLGNRRFVRSQPQTEKLRRFQSFYDVRDLDPESMPAMPPRPLRAPFHLEYLQAVCRERGLSYTKKRPGATLEPHYLEALIERHRQTGHLPSFGRLLRAWQELGTRLGTENPSSTDDEFET